MAHTHMGFDDVVVSDSDDTGLDEQVLLTDDDTTPADALDVVRRWAAARRARRIMPYLAAPEKW